jgi:competence protein ComEC
MPVPGVDPIADPAAGEEAGEEVVRELTDLRLAPIAAVGWAGAWLGTSGQHWWMLVGAAATGMLILAAVLLRSWLLVATALMLAGTLIIGWSQQASLQRSAVAQLAAGGAIARAELRLTDDPSIKPAEGIRPAYLTVRADVLTISGRDRTWQERAPVLVTASGDEVPTWRSITRVRTTLRLEAADPGADFAAVARATGTAVKLDPPGPADRGVERVRAGLRAAVSHGSPEPRALVPSLVLGDTSGITPRITADFLSTGLTHLTAVSGKTSTPTLRLANVTRIERFPWSDGISDPP